MTATLCTVIQLTLSCSKMSHLLLDARIVEQRFQFYLLPAAATNIFENTSHLQIRLSTLIYIYFKIILISCEYSLIYEKSVTSLYHLSIKLKGSSQESEEFRTLLSANKFISNIRLMTRSLNFFARIFRTSL